MPSFKWPVHYDQSPLLGAMPQKRDILLFFKVGLCLRADMGKGLSSLLQGGRGHHGSARHPLVLSSRPVWHSMSEAGLAAFIRMHSPSYALSLRPSPQGDVGLAREPHYSRGIRQAVHKLAMRHEWKEKHQIWIGSPHDSWPGYSSMLAKSRFCLVAPGERGRTVGGIRVWGRRQGGGYNLRGGDGRMTECITASHHHRGPVPPWHSSPLHLPPQFTAPPTACPHYTLR